MLDLLYIGKMAAIAAAGGAVLWQPVSLARRRTAAVLDAAQALVHRHGFRVTRGEGFFGVAVVAGTIDGVAARLVEDRGPTGRNLISKWRLELRLEPPLPISTSVISRPRAKHTAQRSGDDDLRTGDSVFDAVAHVSGDPLDSFVVRESAARAVLRSFLRSGGRVEHGVICFDDAAVARNGRQLSKWVATTIETLSPLRKNQAMPLPDLLVHIARNDPSARLRRSALHHVIRYADSNENVASAIGDAVADPDSEIASLAAASVGIEGRRNLGELFGSRKHSPAARAAALRALVRVDPRAKTTVAALRGASMTNDPELRIAALESAAALGYRDLPIRIGSALDLGLPRVSRAVAELLISHGSPALVPSMLRLLDSADDDSFVLATRALGLHGSLDVAAELFAYASRTDISHDRRASARGAMQQIQSRLGAAHAGAIAIVAVPTGADGAISIVTEPGESTPD